MHSYQLVSGSEAAETDMNIRQTKHIFQTAAS